MDHSCLAEISKLMVMKIEHRGGQHGPKNTIEGYSTGIGEFDFGLDFFGASEGIMVVQEWGKGREHRGDANVLLSFLAAVLFVVCALSVVNIIRRRLSRHGCPHPHPRLRAPPHWHPYPPPPVGREVPLILSFSDRDEKAYASQA